MLRRRAPVVPMLLLAVVGGALLGGARVAARHPSQNPIRLFVDAGAAVAYDRRPDATVMRSRLVAINGAALLVEPAGDSPTAMPPTIELNLFDDVSYLAVLDRTGVSGAGVEWVGHIPGMALSTVTLVSVDHVVAGSIVMPGAVYAIRYLGGQLHEIAQVDQAKYPPELDPIPIDLAATAPQGSSVTGDTGAEPDAASGSPTIDVLVLYTPAAAASAGSATAISARIALGMSEANASYQNSGVLQRVRLVGTQQVAHVENSDLAQDLYAVSNAYGSTPIGDQAAALRDALGADLVMLVTAPSNANACGLSYLMESVSPGFAAFGFSVVEQSCISPSYTFAHELGHNMGARHDWYAENGLDPLRPFTDAHGYVDVPNRFRTVMAYNDACWDQGLNCTRLLYWSNPGVVAPGGHGNAPMGITGGTRSDCPARDAANMACDADDHRVLNQTAQIVAGFRKAVRLTPAIAWEAPGAMTVGTPLGQTQLNATASSGGMPVAGTFVYLPSAGTVMGAAGTQTLSVTFTPADATLYATATGAVTVQVTGGGASPIPFSGPGSGGPAMGVVRGATLIYNGAAYPVVNGRVVFPDCSVYIALDTGVLIPAGAAPDCPPARAASGGAAPAIQVASTRAPSPVSPVVAGGGAFVGPSTGGPSGGTVGGGVLTYNGAAYPVVNGKVTFPDCRVYIALDNGMLIAAGTDPGCTSGGAVGGSSSSASGNGGGSPVAKTAPVTWATPAAMAVGTPLGWRQLNATTTVWGSFAYRPAAGTMLPEGTHVLSVTFTPGDTTTYATTTVSVNLVVLGAGGTGGASVTGPVGVAFVGPTSGGAATGSVSGATLSYNGVAYPIVNGKVTFPDCTVYIALDSGMLIRVGTAPGCTPGTGGGVAAATAPIIEWATPMAINAGTALDWTQLNATASVLGFFTYTPASGTVLAPGTHTLSAMFTPTDASRYTSATAAVSIVVFGTNGAGGGFVGPGSGGPATGSVSGTTLLYNGAAYPVVDGRVRFPDCTIYIALDNGMLISVPSAPGCDSGGGI